MCSQLRFIIGTQQTLSKNSCSVIQFATVHNEENTWFSTRFDFITQMQVYDLHQAKPQVT